MLPALQALVFIWVCGLRRRLLAQFAVDHFDFVAHLAQPVANLLGGCDRTVPAAQTAEGERELVEAAMAYRVVNQQLEGRARPDIVAD